MQTVAGLATARGYVSGPVFVYRGDGEIPVPEYVTEPGHEGDELLLLKRAQYETRRDLEGLVAALKERTGQGDVRIFECHLMLLDDPLLIGEAEKLVIESHVNAAAAIRKVADKARARFGRMNDPYFRERVRDIDDVERRLLKAIVGISDSPSSELKVPSIVVADDLTPSETIQLPRDFVLGFATNKGSTTSHVALLARAMGIPAVTGLGNITERVAAGEVVLLDGTNGAVTLNPDDRTRAQFEDLVRRQNLSLAAAVSGAPAGTLRDGGEVLVYANLHPGVPVAGLRELGARGVGLYRSEYLWLNRELEPTEDEQFEAYRDAAKFAATLDPKSSITIRTLDIGGDKMVRGISDKEANPFLGNRSIRYLLSHRQTFLTQLRAILRATAYGRVCIMYPMVSCVEELQEAARVLAEAKASLERDGLAFVRETPIGAMIEVPAAALNADALAKYVDFFSIGTNDLVQYTMAADRGNESVAHLYQPTNPAVLKLMRLTIDAAKRNGIYVGVCGESAADPIIGVLWAAMGIDILSMSATYIPVIAKLLSRLSRAELDEYRTMAESLPATQTAQETFDACYRWMKGKMPDLDEMML